MMTAGELSRSELWEEYYTVLLNAYSAMREAFKKSGLTQDQIAERLGVDKALVSKRLNTRENLTLKTLSFMASAMECRLSIAYTPYEEVEAASRLAQPQSSTKTTDSSNIERPIVQVEAEPIDEDAEPVPSPEVGIGFLKKAA